MRNLYARPLAALALVLACAAAAPAALGDAKNGNFEKPAVTDPSGVQQYSTGQKLKGWTVTDGSAALVTRSYTSVFKRKQALELLPGQSDTVSETLKAPEGVYSVSFAARTSADPGCVALAPEVFVQYGVFFDSESLTGTWQTFQTITETDDVKSALSIWTDGTSCPIFVDDVEVAAS